MKRKAGDDTARTPDGLPLSANPDLAADSRGRILDQWEGVAIADREQSSQVARHADLVHGEYGSGPRGHRLLHPVRIDVIGIRVDIDKDRGRAAISDAVGGCNKRVARGDDFVTFA